MPSRFEDLRVWQKARELTQKIYEVTNRREFSRDFGLRDQIPRAAVSVMSNIAEGFERGSGAEFGSAFVVPLHRRSVFRARRRVEPQASSWHGGVALPPASPWTTVWA
jgi:hypothetical protein